MIAGKVIMFNPGNTNVMMCFDPETERNCTGSWPVTVPLSAAGSGGVVPDLFPFRNTADGADSGVCIGGSPQVAAVGTRNPVCYNMDGTSMGSLDMDPRQLRYIAVSGETYGTRILMPGGSGVDCFDMATNARCTNFNGSNLVPTSEMIAVASGGPMF